MSNKKSINLSLSFIDTLTETKDLSGLALVLKLFDFIDDNDEMREALDVDDKLAVIRGVLQPTIKHLYADKPDQRDEYLLLTSNLFSDTQDIGTLISLLMKGVEELNKLKKMSGPEKKKFIHTLFNKIIDYSPFDENEKRLARYAFGGIVELAIWAKHGGLKETKKRCLLMCK